MKSKLFVGFVILFFLASCSGREKERSEGQLRGKEEVLSETALDAVDLAIVMYAKRASFNPVPISPDIKQHLSKYGEGTSFEMSYNNITVPFLKNGVKIIIPPGGEFVCKYEGEMNYHIKLTEGEVGILNKNIYVKEGSKAQVDTVSYVFLRGKWRKSQ